RNPYHNFGHMLHVPVMCWQACGYYADVDFDWFLSEREKRNLLIAAPLGVMAREAGGTTLGDRAEQWRQRVEVRP
ncbi:MAG: hypothetical protein PHF72_15460, partial [Gammaproteobacteria bacterium]|nr:hypothetical protein [Gammaproteobacteria bacterium]